MILGKVYIFKHNLKIIINYYDIAIIDYNFMIINHCIAESPILESSMLVGRLIDSERNGFTLGLAVSHQSCGRGIRTVVENIFAL